MGKKHNGIADAVSVIEKAIRCLPNGESRFAISKYPLSQACLSGFNGPDIQEQICFDYSMPAENKEIAKDYFEEIATLQKILDEADFAIELADSQRGAKLEAVEIMHKGLNRRAYAMRLWDWYGIPWRYKNGLVHLVWSPRDVIGSPIIHSCTIDTFLCSLVDKQETLFIKATRDLKRLALWKNVGMISLALIVILSLIFIPDMLPK